MLWVRFFPLSKLINFLFYFKKNNILTYFLYISDFARDHPEYIAKDNSLGFMSSDNGENYNLCHC